ncbi:hypothetical protein [Amycolatopsis sp. FDAARGOS 1241]|uniref:hypothetical protein n=1 Tax=Amycolatopsis sp. FDAARGOS 1241 TaxID=2778070 RepID=UPI00195065D5|nr:hypothetical protein [Amycolatopsis sp. FDAARGOS 1241]QRP44187.1 hypothetical protein I6J71_33570 [Amycolatopsis sp. FDAARGOS 1241]
MRPPITGGFPPAASIACCAGVGENTSSASPMPTAATAVPQHSADASDRSGSFWHSRSTTTTTTAAVAPRAGGGVAIIGSTRCVENR